MQKESTFYNEALQVRKEFVRVAATYDVGRHNALRTEIDSLLIMYDQAIQKAKKLDEFLDNDCPACASGTDHCGY